LERAARRADSDGSWMRLADAAVLWGDATELDLAIEAYRAAARRQADQASVAFRLGNALRMRYESTGREPGDFQDAVNQWGVALARDPNQYIWRRRLQQYGPRLAKPYPFYDWVARAEEQIRERGEVPVVLPVRPTGAEIAQPATSLDSRALGHADARQPPDPRGQISRDKGQLIELTAAVVPARIEPGEAIRVHLELRPTSRAVWNNEAEPLRVWLDVPPDWVVESPLIEAPSAPEAAESRETRQLEFEVQAPRDLSDQHATFRGYAVYHACEHARGTCVYRRQDFQIAVRTSE
jgi:hypothetical protein